MEKKQATGRKLKLCKVWGGRDPSPEHWHGQTRGNNMPMDEKQVPFLKKKIRAKSSGKLKIGEQEYETK